MAAEERWYHTKAQLENSPSKRCGIDPEKELSYRQQAANFIQDMGQRLQVNQLCINTAIVYMHRFYMAHSFSRFHRNAISTCALFLAAKVEEQPRKLEHVIKVAHLCLHRDAPTLDPKSEAYLEQAQELVIHENIMLETLGFDVAIDHPHTHVVKCCQLVRGGWSSVHQVHASKDLAQTSYFMATNSLHLTTMCLQYKPTVVACVCIHLACKWANWEIPRSSEGKRWFWYVDKTVTEELLEELTAEFLAILDRCPSRLKRKMMSAASGMEKMPDPANYDKKLNVDFANLPGCSSKGSPSAPGCSSAAAVASTSKGGGDHFSTPLPALVRANLFSKSDGTSNRPTSNLSNAVDRRPKKEASAAAGSANSLGAATQSTSKHAAAKQSPEHRHGATAAARAASPMATDFPATTSHNNSADQPPHPMSSQPLQGSPANAAKKAKPASKEYRAGAAEGDKVNKHHHHHHQQHHQQQQHHEKPQGVGGPTKHHQGNHVGRSHRGNTPAKAAAAATAEQLQAPASKPQPVVSKTQMQAASKPQQSQTPVSKPQPVSKISILTPSPPLHREDDFVVSKMDEMPAKFMATPPTPLLPVVSEPQVRQPHPMAAAAVAKTEQYRKRDRDINQKLLTVVEPPPPPQRRHETKDPNPKERQTKPHKSKTPPVNHPAVLAATPVIAQQQQLVSEPQQPPTVQKATEAVTKQFVLPPSDLNTVDRMLKEIGFLKNQEHELFVTVPMPRLAAPQVQPMAGNMSVQPLTATITANNAVATPGSNGNSRPAAKNSSSASLNEAAPPHSRLPAQPQIPVVATATPQAKSAKAEPAVVPMPQIPGAAPPARDAAKANSRAEPAVVPTHQQIPSASPQVKPAPPQPIPAAIVAPQEREVAQVVRAATPPPPPVTEGNGRHKTPHQSSKREKRHKAKSRDRDKERSHDKKEKESSMVAAATPANPAIKLFIPKERLNLSVSSKPAPPPPERTGGLKLKISKEKLNEGLSNSFAAAPALLATPVAPPQQQHQYPAPPPESTGLSLKIKITKDRNSATGSYNLSVGSDSSNNSNSKSESRKRERDPGSGDAAPSKMAKTTARSSRRTVDGSAGNGRGLLDVPPSSNTRSSRQEPGGGYTPHTPLLQQQQQQQPPHMAPQRGRKGGMKPMGMPPHPPPYGGHQVGMGPGGGYPYAQYYAPYGAPPLHPPNMQNYYMHQGDFASQPPPQFFNQFVPPPPHMAPRMQFTHPPPPHLMQQRAMPPLPREPPPAIPPPPPPE